jgi:hypothetical protein
MKCIIRWKTKSRRPPRSTRLSKLDQVLEMAAQSGYYRRRRIALPESAPAGEQSLSTYLEALPRVELKTFLSHPVEFYNWNHSPRPLRPLECPLRHTGRTALLSDGFEEVTATQTFAYHTFDELEDFQPDSLAGPVNRLLGLAEAVLAGRLHLNSLTSAIVVFSGLKHGCLKNEDRDLLWRAFQLPVFEQFRGFSMELLAWECEAHDGLHINADNAIFENARDGELLLTCLDSPEYAVLRVGTEMSAEIVMEPCGCGQTAPRLVGLRPVDTPVLAMVASA